jgi:hypothetical protein
MGGTQEYSRTKAHCQAIVVAKIKSEARSWVSAGAKKLGFILLGN